MARAGHRTSVRPARIKARLSLLFTMDISDHFDLLLRGGTLVLPWGRRRATPGCARWPHRRHGRAGQCDGGPGGAGRRAACAAPWRAGRPAPPHDPYDHIENRQTGPMRRFLQRSRHVLVACWRLLNRAEYFSPPSPRAYRASCAAPQLPPYLPATSSLLSMMCVRRCCGAA